MTSPAARRPTKQPSDRVRRLPQRVAGTSGSSPGTFVAPTLPDADRPVIDAAIRMIRELHVPGQGGCCNGCVALWQRVIPYAGCPQMAWAAQVGNVARSG
jgi:hypothetical protein